MQPQRPRAGVQSVELLLDAASQTRTERLWGQLLDAGMPSQARHRGASNRPHITLVALPNLPDGAEERVASAAAAAQLPVLGTWGDVGVFGHGPFTLVWLGERSAGMRRLHEEVALACAVPAGHLTAPDRWTPHVTLARRVSVADLDAVRGLVAGSVEDARGTPLDAPTLRRWDGAAKVDWIVSSAAGQP